MRYALIDSTGIVSNVIECEENYSIDGYTLVQSDTANINDSYDKGIFTPSITTI